MTGKSISTDRQDFKDDVLALEGHFSVDIIDSTTGDVIWNWSKKNQIVDGARKILAHLISEGCSAQYNALNLFRLGGRPLGQTPSQLPPDYVDAVEILNPTSPGVSDVEMVYGESGTFDYFYEIRPGDLDVLGNDKWVDPVFPNAPNETSVRFEFIVPDVDAVNPTYNPTPYLAAGIYYEGSSDLTLFASQTFPVMVKTVTRIFRFTWEIRF